MPKPVSRQSVDYSQRLVSRSNSGSFVTFAAIRRASGVVRAGFQVSSIPQSGPAAPRGGRDLLTLHHRPQIAELAVRYRLPSIYDNRDYVVDGGLISYGADTGEIFRRSATYVDRI